MVGLPASPLPTTQGSRKQSPVLLWGHLMSPLLITQGSQEQSLGISIRQDADPMLEAVHPATYLHLLIYAR